MYSLKKIIIMTNNYNLSDQELLETVVMVTEGMRIRSLLYINDINSIGSEKKDLKKEIKSELYDDMYDEDELKIKLKEAINGEDAICKVRKFIEKYWDEDTLIYFYEPNIDCYNYLEKLLKNDDVRIYLQNYKDLFSVEEINNDIYNIMKINGLKTENLIKDNKISMIYFLNGLVEVLLNK